MSRPASNRLAAVVALVMVFASGCKFSGIYSFPLPGAVANGGHSYTLNVQFRDVQDLVPYAAVKVNDATVGHVKSVGVQGQHALVVVQVKDAVKLPANTTALISQTSLLGEKFVALQSPSNLDDWRGRLLPGSTIGLAATDSDATVEEVLGALALLLNGGGLQQIQTITHEVDKALTGRENNVRDLLTQISTFATGLNAQKDDIITALDRVNNLAKTISKGESSVTDAIDRLPSALRVLADNRRLLTTMLTSLRSFGDVAVKVVNSSREDLLANLRNLQPTLTALAKAGNEIPPSLQILATYPQADGTEDVYRGDYTNLDVTVDLSATSLAKNFGLSNLGGLPLSSGAGTTPKPQTSKAPAKLPLPVPVPTKLPIPVPSTLPLLPKSSPTPRPSSPATGGGLLGGILGGNAATQAHVEVGPSSPTLTTPLDRLVLGALQ